ncbi:MAG: hypothetical protein Q4A37_00340 [Candidatus Saccharibacteria bacterium]|nr:hypothetical protein [Candidatus Saccharibacteria bacterium]
MELHSELNLSALLPLAQSAVAADEHLLSQAVATFARDNGFLYAQRAEGVLPRYDLGDSPAWFGFEGALASGKRVSHHISGYYMGLPIEMFEMTEMAAITDMTGRRDESLVKGIIRVHLPVAHPHILLDSNKNDYQNEGSVRASYGERYRVTLEGDFPRYFELYAVQDAPIDVRVLLAPNMMDMLVRSSHRFDVELFDNELILMTRDSLYHPDVMRDAVQALREQLLYLQRLQQNRSIQGPFSHMKRSFVNGAPVVLWGRKIAAPHFLSGVMLIMGGMAMVLVLLFPQSVKSSLAYIIPPILIVAGIAAWRSGR